ATVAMSLEILFGTDTPAGLEKAPTESDNMVSAAASAPDTPSNPARSDVRRSEARPQAPHASLEQRTSNSVPQTEDTAARPSTIESASKDSPAEAIAASTGEAPEIVVRSEPRQMSLQASTRRDSERSSARPERKAAEPGAKPQQPGPKNQSSGSQQAKKET